MPSIHLPYINIALDAFALVVALVLASSCLSEISRKNLRGRYFFFETVGISVALFADMVAWFCEGRLALAPLTVISNTLATCAGCVVSSPRPRCATMPYRSGSRTCAASTNP